MTQPTLFDDLYREPLQTPLTREPLSPTGAERTGERLKREGIARAVESKANAVGYARELAYDIARSREDRCCTMIDVNEALAKEGRAGLGNAAGGVFLSSVWEDTGRVVKDTRPQAHSNKLTVWRLR